jgi:aerobic carbon-monoxide dehydrogenase small subunit
MAQVNVTVDGVRYQDEVEPRLLLVQYLRERLGKVGTVIGCGETLDGRHLGAADGTLHPIQRAFHNNHALQCGFCTPGMMLAACDLLKNNPDPTEAEIREGIEGNLCRCTGYQNIVRAVQSAAAEMTGAAQ